MLMATSKNFRLVTNWLVLPLLYNTGQTSYHSEYRGDGEQSAWANDVGLFLSSFRICPDEILKLGNLFGSQLTEFYPAPAYYGKAAVDGAVGNDL